MIAIEDKKIRRKFIFVNSIRIAVLSALIFISVFLLLFDIPFPARPIIIALGVAFLCSLLHFPLFKRLNYRVAVYIQLMVDITLITILVYFSQAFRSPFYFLYILPIIVSAVFLNRRDTIYIASLSFIVFGVLSNLIYLEIIPFYPPNAAVEISLGNFVYNLAMSILAFSSVAFLSSYYFDRLRKTDAELRNARENLRDMILLNNTVMEKMENGFITSDSNGAVISYNEKAKSMLKINAGSNIFDLLFSKFDANQIRKISQEDNKNYFEIQSHLLTLGVSVSIIEKIYSFDKLFVFIVTDLTQRRAIEEELKKKEHLALIGEMSAGIAHEIRNPLASISGSVQFLSKELQFENEEYKKLMDIIVRESTRLSNSIEYFLEFTKVTPLERSQVDMAALIDEIAELVLIHHQGVTLIRKYSPGYWVSADMKKMKQALWNLITNAIKAVNENGTIEINLYRNEDDVYLSIADNGIGIAPADLPRIFTPFYSRFTSGIGLGMALVKRIMDDHGFEITIDSQKDIGTEIRICFRKKQKY
ncbi:MAG: sensor histidine kinase [Candidatus Omnitrophota bacterium]